ncbi:MAG TPA: 3-phosphoshikimate 1-carboxyvinyltransferase [Candidatus Kapabacteria bacterium]|nr:3-phosphoshikimate 1-carboxyvinyltransferase [Candidatus Kapabacteria bacterium]
MKIENVELSRVTSNGLGDSSPIRVLLPPDKSIFHRILFLAALSNKTVRIPIGDIIAGDVRSTINALKALGVSIQENPTELIIKGAGRGGFRKPGKPIDCGNSGTTARLLMGILSGQSFDSTLIGDESLSKRPMKRLASLLERSFRAAISTSENGTLPVHINGKRLHSGNIDLPIASAQVKTAALLAAYCADIQTAVTEPYPSRDHTEILLQAFGIDLKIESNSIFLRTGRELHLPTEFQIPDDVSAAAFFVAAGVIGKVDVRIPNASLNPSRTAYLDILNDSGVPIWFEEVASKNGERVGTIVVNGSSIRSIKPFQLSGSIIPNVQDEIPALAVIALFADGFSNISGASELRKKESDRLEALAENIRSAGGTIEESEDGLLITGSKEFKPSPTIVTHHNDHRIAMAMSILGLTGSAVTIPDASVVSISFPSFFSELQKFPRANTIILQ